MALTSIHQLKTSTVDNLQIILSWSERIAYSFFEGDPILILFKTCFIFDSEDCIVVAVYRM
jgi:hypothetical protein